MPLGTEVGIGPGDIVLDGVGTQFLPKGAQQTLTFRPMSIVVRRRTVSHLSATAKLLFVNIFATAGTFKFNLCNIVRSSHQCIFDELSLICGCYETQVESFCHAY